MLTALSVLLGVSFVAGTFVLTDTMDEAFTGILTKANAGTDVLVRGGEGAGSAQNAVMREQLPLALGDTVGAVDGVKVAVPALEGSAVLVGADGTAVRRGGAPTLGFAWLDDDPALDLVAGRAPASAQEIAVEEGTLQVAGLALGDATTVIVGGEVLPVTVVGSVRFGALAGATLVLLEESTAQRLFAPEGTTAWFTVQGTGEVSQAELRDRVSAVLPAGAEAITGEQKNEEDAAAIQEALGFINTFLLVFAGISLVVGGFIIVNTFSMLVAQRTRELALLRAVGASARQVVTSVCCEALLVGLVGGVLGFGGGLGLAALLRAGMASFGLELTGPLIVEPRTVVASVLVGTVVTVLAAVVPAVRASRIPPVAAMRDDVALPERALRARGVVGAALVVAGALGLWASLLAEGTASGVGVGVSALVLFIGTAVAAPLVARPVLRVLGAPFVALPGAIGRLARQNALRNPRRTATTASALMVGLALVTGITVLSASATASTRSIVSTQVSADLVMRAGYEGFPSTVVDDVAAVDGVASVAGLGAVPLSIAGQHDFGVATRADALAANVAVDMQSGRLAALDDGEVLVSSSFARDHDLTTGDTLTATVGVLPDQRLKIGGVYAVNQAIGANLVVPRSLGEQAVPSAHRTDFFGYVKFEPGADAAAVRAAVTEAVAPFVVVSVQDRDEFVDAQAAEIDQLLVMIYVLLALSVVIAVLGIVNTLALSVVERTREIGLLRAVGMRRRQLAGTVTVESVLTALFGAVLGTGLGLVLGVSLQRALVDNGLTVLEVPAGRIAMVFAVAAVVGVLAAVLPAIRAVRLDVLRAVATD
jgi:putative ABC transport system permease protein